MGAASRNAWIVAQDLVARRGLFRPKDLAARGVSRVFIDHLRLDGVLVLQPPGVLAAPNRLYPPDVCAALKWPNAVLTGPSALAVRGRHPEPSVPWLCIDRTAHRPVSPMPCVFWRCRALRGDPDVETVDFEGVPVRAFSVERALTELLRMLERVPLTVELTSALQAALEDGAATVAGIERCARARRQWPTVRAALALLSTVQAPPRAESPIVRQYLPLRASPWDRLYGIQRSLRWHTGDIVLTHARSVTRREAVQLAPPSSRAAPAAGLAQRSP